MSIFSRKTSVNILLLSINIMLLTIISRVVIADETTSTLLEQSIYLYYYESDDELLGAGESQLYTFAPIPGEDITIVSYGLDDMALTSVVLFDNNRNEVGAGTSNQITEKPDNADADTPPQSPYITAIQHTANSSGLYSFEVRNESEQEGLIRTMLFIGEPFNTDLTLIDELNPLLPSKAFMVAGDPNREWIDELTGEINPGLRTEVDVLPIERIDRAPDVFLSHSTLSELPNVGERLEPLTFKRWFNQDEQEIYLVNIRPLPEQETTASRTVLENIDYQTYNSNNFFFFEYLFSVGNGSDPVALDRGAGACAGLADRVDCVSSDPNLGRETDSSTTETTVTAAASVVEETTQLTVQGEVVTVAVGTDVCTTFAGTAGKDVTITVSGTSTTSCLPDQYIPASGTLTTTGITDVQIISGTQRNLCEGTSGDDVIACTTSDDWIEALEGDDAIFADAGDDEVFGGDGDDFIVAGDGDDNVDGGSGYDEIDGGAGNDTINLGAEGGVTIGGTGTDTFVIDSTHTTSGTASKISGGDNLDPFTGDSEQDIYQFDGSPDGTIELYTDSTDRLDFTTLDSSVTVYPDSVSVSGSSLSVTVVDGTLPSNISGSAYDDTFNLDGGCVVGVASGCVATVNYSVDGNDGADTINTGDGIDTINGGAGNDTINSGSGIDTIDGGADDDTINSGTGNDTIKVSDGDGNDTIDGGTGTDLIDGSTASNGLIVTLNNATGTIEDTVTGDIDYVSNVENVDTGSGDDQFFISDTDDNVINGASGTDVATVSGGSGIILVDRTGDLVDVTDSGGGIGTDQYNLIETINISGSAGNDIVLVSDENDNTITGNGGSDIVLAIKNTAVSGSVTITRTGDDVNVSGTGFGTDLYEAISTVYVTGSTEDDTFELTDEYDNTITGDGGSDTVNVYSTAGSTDDETITITRTASSADVTVISVISGSGGSGIGSDNYNDIDQVNITAGGGDDTFEIFDELDNIFDGGDGNDTANYSAISGGLTITFDSSDIDTVSGTGIGTDILINIENINGGSGDDTFFITDEGDNALDGGDGTDEATTIMENVYSGVITIIRDPANVVTVSGSGFGTDVYTNIEKVNVTSVGGDDVFRPNDDQNNDFDAGDGTDWIDYSTITGSVSVIVNISTGEATGDGFDTLTNFENISGSIGSDTLTGDDTANVIDGNSGDDEINGGGGDDTLIGNTGDDKIDGGSGTDTLDETNATTDMDVTLVSGDGSVSSTGQGNDTLISIENVNTGSGDDTFSITDSGDNTINANGGDDVATVEDGSGTITVTRSGDDVTVTDDGGGIGTDQYNSVEQVNVSGSTNDDTFIVDDANDNELNGLDGSDTISYSSISTTITATINGSNIEIEADGTGTDTLISFENVTTGSGDDYFSISGAVDTNLTSNAGDDVFAFGVASGILTLSDVSGSTFLDFTNYTTGVVIDLDSTSQQTVNLSGSTLLLTLSGTGGTFNNVSGSGYVDNISGTAGVDTIYGGAGDDSIWGEGDADFLYGDAGADTIDGGAGADTIDGGADNDTLSGGADADTIDGGTGTDTLNGDAGADTLNGGDDADTLNGGADADTLNGDAGNDILNGDAGNDILNGGADADTINGGADDDTINGGSGNDDIDGGSGTDLIDESARTNALIVVLDNVTGVGYIEDTVTNEKDYVDNVENVDTGTGLDLFFIDDTDDNIINAGDDDDVATVYSGSGTITITRSASGSGTDVAVSDTGGGIGTDQYNSVTQVNVSGSASDDTFIVTDSGDNILDGDDGEDTISYETLTTPITVTVVGNQVTISATGTGEDTLYNFENVTTGTGDDYFNISGDVDVKLDSTTGADIFEFNMSAGGSLELDAGGSTHLEFGDYGNGITIDLGSAVSQSVDSDLIVNLSGTFTSISGSGYDDNISGTAGVDTIYGGGDDDSIWGEGDADFLYGDAGADTIDGGAGADTIDGGADNDTLSGGADADTIDGGSGTDTLNGDAGADILNGGDDADTLNGGADADTLNGDAGADILNGDGGDDILNGGADDDTIDGGSGTDTIDESAETNALVVTLNNATGTIVDATASETDTVLNVENVDTGSGLDLFFIDDTDDNIINAGDDDDVATVYSGSGTITITRSASGSGTDVAVSDTGGGIGTDQYNSVTQVNVSGSATDDTFILSDSGDNILDGGDGEDTISYKTHTTPITVTIVGNQVTISATDTGEDTLYNFENVTTGTGDDYFDISGEVDINLDSTTSTVSDIFDFNTSVSGSLGLEASGNTHLEFGNYGEGITIDLGSAVSQSVDTDLIVNLSGTFTSISGSGYADNISGSAGVDTIYGGADADSIWGEGDADFLYGGAGADTIDGGAGADTIDGGAGADTIDGGAGADTIDGGADDDTLSGGADDDTIDGGSGTDTIDESAETNALIVTLNNATGTIVDTVTGETDSVLNIENVSTGDGDDKFFISDSDDNIIDGGSETSGDEATVSGGTGTITVTRSASGTDVTVSDGSGSGGIGDDQYLDIEQINVSGSSSDDTFIVDDANDNDFNGLGGDDTISYAALSTPITVTIVGSQASISATGIGADTLYNIENIFTGTGDDYFDINGTVDYGLNSSSGADTFFFNASVDGSLALETSDSAHLDFGSFTSSGITIDLSSAVSQSITGSLEIKLTGTFTSISGTTLADNISGTTGVDTIWAASGTDTIYGDAGADFLYGGADADTIDGGADADTIDGGTGNDTLTGGAGDDIIDGGDDTDTFDESNSSSNITVVLESASGTSTSAVEGTDTLTNIENVTTGSGADDFTLSDGGLNVISASSGTDTVTILNAISITVIRSGDDVFVTDNATGVGDDEYYSVELVNISGTSADNIFIMNDEFNNIINGQGGSNEVNYSLVTAVINVNALSTGTSITSTGIGTDTLINIQDITTGDGDDIFIIEENGVDNVYDGAGGSSDTATYRISGAVTATRSGSSVTVQVSGSDTDQLDNIEIVNFEGDTTDDTFVIQDTNNNTIDGKGSGADSDTYDTSFTSNDITVTVSSTVTAADDGSAIGTDTLVDIENITTGSGDDIFIINTDVAGTYFFNAGDSTLGNTFQFTGDATAEVHITISSDSPEDDLLDFSQFTGSGSGIDIDLSDNTEQQVATNLYVTFTSFIGDVVGTDNADTIEGNSLSNNISGGAGNDTIVYSAGDDIIDGGAGVDGVDYTGAPDSITATLTSSSITVAISSTSDTNTLTNIEVITGTSNDDTFIINEAVSTTINAEGGTDTVDYSGLTSAIEVDLSTGIGHVSGTSSSDDHTLNDIEDVIGSDLNDNIVGNSSVNNLDGGAGDDFIQGNGDDDIIDGGSGTNTVSYKDSGSSVDVNLESGSSSGGDGNDTLSNIQNVSGSAYDDNISGSSGTNVIYGGAGVDVIYGNEGDDEIYGEAGNDTLYGGSLDAVSGTSDDGADTIYGGAGQDDIYGGNDNTNGGTGNDGADTIYGGDDNDTIYGGNNNDATGSGDDAGDTLIDGGDGNDTIYGGNNNTDGGSGNDTSGSDTIEGGEGDDNLYGGNNNFDGGSGDDGDDTINDATNAIDDNDLVVGDNNNKKDGGGGTEGTGAGGSDTIDVDEGNGADGSEQDVVVGDNQTSDATGPAGDNNTDDTGDPIDTIITDDDGESKDDKVDEGDGKDNGNG